MKSVTTREPVRAGNSGAAGDWAICCSGGGIRSAAYRLGALQSLGQDGPVAKARWILGVSGGSYIAASRALVAHDLPRGTQPRYWWWTLPPNAQRPGRGLAALKPDDRDRGDDRAWLVSWAARLTAALALAMLAVPALISWLTSSTGSLGSIAHFLGFGAKPSWSLSGLAGLIAAVAAVARYCQAGLAKWTASTSAARGGSTAAGLPGPLGQLAGKVRQQLLPWLGSTVVVLIGAVLALLWVSDGHVLKRRLDGRRSGALWYRVMQPTLGLKWAAAAGRLSYRGTWMYVTDGRHYDNLGSIPPTPATAPWSSCTTPPSSRPTTSSAPRRSSAQPNTANLPSERPQPGSPPSLPPARQPPQRRQSPAGLKHWLPNADRRKSAFPIVVRLIWPNRKDVNNVFYSSHRRRAPFR